MKEELEPEPNVRSLPFKSKRFPTKAPSIVLDHGIPAAHGSQSHINPDKS